MVIVLTLVFQVYTEI